MCFVWNKKSTSKVLSGGFCLQDLEAKKKHYSSCIFNSQMSKVSPLLLEHINKIHLIES